MSIIEFEDDELHSLAEKGYAEKFANVPKEIVEDLCFAITDLYYATCVEDLANTPFNAVLIKDNVYQLFLKKGWLLYVYLVIKKEENNYVKVMSLLKDEVYYGKPA